MVLILVSERGKVWCVVDTVGGGPAHAHFPGTLNLCYKVPDPMPWPQMTKWQCTLGLRAIGRLSHSDLLLRNLSCELRLSPFSGAEALAARDEKQMTQEERGKESKGETECAGTLILRCPLH